MRWQRVWLHANQGSSSLQGRNKVKIRFRPQLSATARREPKRHHVEDLGALSHRITQAEVLDFQRKFHVPVEPSFGDKQKERNKQRNRQRGRKKVRPGRPMASHPKPAPDIPDSALYSDARPPLLARMPTRGLPQLSAQRRYERELVKIERTVDEITKIKPKIWQDLKHTLRGTNTVSEHQPTNKFSKHKSKAEGVAAVKLGRKMMERRFLAGDAELDSAMSAATAMSRGLLFMNNK